MADYLTNTTDLTAVANAIRSKGGTSAALEYPDEFVSAINAISTGGGGATEYTITDSNGLYDITSAGLTQSDFAQGSGTSMWIEFTTATTTHVYLDEFGDDDFRITIPAGTIASCVSVQSNGSALEGIFTFSCGASAPYGWFLVGAFSSGEAYIVTNGEDPSYGCAVSTSGYMVGNVGCPVLDINGQTTLHILKYN